MNRTGYESAERLSPDPLKAALAGLGATFRGSVCSCPFHDDGHPSASIHADAEGVWRFKCHAASCGFYGDVFDVRARAEGLPLRDVLPRSERIPAHVAASQPKPPRLYATLGDLAADCPNAVATYRYTNPESGGVDLAVIRCEPPGGKKEFRQARPERGGWVQRKPAGKMPLYNRTRVKAAAAVVVVEGEKCVHALTPALPPSAAATTSPGGAGKGRAAEADWSPLAGKVVYLWPDADPADEKTGHRGGVDHMRAVAAELNLLEPRPDVHWLDCDRLGLPPKGDAADWVAIRSGRPASEVTDELVRVLESAEPLSPSEPLRRFIERVVSGELTPIMWPDWPQLSRLSQALIPGSLTVLCGEAGAGKSFWVVQALAGMARSGIKVALYALEERREFHLQRLLAQVDGNASLTDMAWVAANRADAMAAYARHRPELDAFARRLETVEVGQPTYADVLAWADRQFAAGVRVLCVDPITAAAPDEKPWAEDLKLVIALKQRAEHARASVIVTTHPRKGSKAGTSPLDDMSGGAAFARFAQTVAWLKRLDQPEDGTLGTKLGAVHARWNRVLHLTKTRFGRGAGMKIAYWFRPGELTFAERGVVGDAERRQQQED